MPRKPAPPPSMEIRLLGPFGVTVGGVPVEEKAWTRRKAKLLVKLLALQPHHRMHREQLMEALWPEQEPESAADGLYKALYVARKALGPEGSRLLATEGQQIVMSASGGLWVDAEAFEQAAHGASSASGAGAVGALESALALYTGDLLVEDIYEDWAAGRREQLRSLRIDLLSNLARIEEARGQYDRSVERLRELVAADSVNEDAHRRLMKLYAGMGQRHLALRQYQLCCEALRRDLDAEPERATIALHERVVAGDVPELPSIDPAAGVAPTAVSPKAEPAADVAQEPPPSNLPRPITSFVGRSRAVTDVRRALEVSRLVTLLGPGGVGKTRLALESAAGSHAEFPDGIWFVDLSPARDETAAMAAVAAAIGVREAKGQTVADSVRAALSNKRALLVFDNCEQVVEAGAAIIDDLLQKCSTPRVLATSREPLGVAGEAVWRVPSLSLPRHDRGASVDDLLEFEATRLFLDRVRLADASFDVTDAITPIIARICHRLDGIPLAIELAAACVRAFSIEQLEARLDDRFRLLTGGARTSMPRHRTLRAAVDWSYDLLADDERALLMVLSTFEGGWDLDDAEGVVEKDEGRRMKDESEPELRNASPASDLHPSSFFLHPSDVMALLPRLVDKSLVVVERRDGEVRYRFLETIREYAAEKLRDAGREEAARAAHADWFLTLATRADAVRHGPDYMAWLRRLETEHDNLRAALRWARAAPARGELALQLTTLLAYFWNLHGHWTEGRRLLDAALAAAPEAPLALRARALDAAGSLAQRQGDLERARELYEQGLAICDDDQRIAVLCHNLAIVMRDLGGYDRAEELYGRSLALHRALGNRFHVATALNGLGVLATDRGDLGRARDYFVESATILEALGNARGAGASLHNIGEISVRAGDFESAAHYLERSLALAREHGFKDLAADSIGALAALADRRGEYERAEALYKESLAIFYGLGAKSGTAAVLEGLARTAAARGHAERAVCLEGAAMAVRESIGWSLPPSERASLDEALEPVRSALGEEETSAVYARGKSMTFDEAVAFANQ
jgi:predicted ATPase/DNA-binding SARP family transcriptional activator